MNKNNTKKYLKYAIGEIILVVIGILIAIQINNLNERRKAKDSEIVLLQKLKEENTLNLNSIEDHVELRKELPNVIYDFIDFLNKEKPRNHINTTKDFIAEIGQTAAYTFIQSNLKNYVNTHNSENSALSNELATLEFNQNDLQLSSTKGLDLKIDYFFEALSNDIDLNSLEIKSYDTLESLKFRNNMMILSGVEAEISLLFSKTYKQMVKVDSLIAQRLSD